MFIISFSTFLCRLLEGDTRCKTCEHFLHLVPRGGENVGKRDVWKRNDG